MENLKCVACGRGFELGKPLSWFALNSNPTRKIAEPSKYCSWWCERLDYRQQQVYERNRDEQEIQQKQG